MAEQIGPFQFRGKLGNLVGKQVNGKNIVTTPGGLSSKQIKDKSRKSNKRIHENWNEFRMATRLANKIYQNLKGQTSIAHFHPDAQARLTGEILKFRVLDTTSARGERKPTVGALSLLKDYFLSDPKLNIWSDLPQIEKNDDDQIKITIRNPETAFNLYKEYSDNLKVKVIIQHIDLDNLVVLEVKSFDQTVDYHSTQAVEWTAQLFPDHNLVAIATHFYKENNGFVFPLYERKRCSCYIADFFI
jgi:hypothetical protein